MTTERENCVTRILSRSRSDGIGIEPDYRYSLANERTFLSWIRTALALIAAGIAIVQYAPDLGPRRMRLALGLALIMIAGAISGSAHHRWISRERAMRLKAVLPRGHFGIVLGYGLSAVAVAVIVALAAPL